MKKMNKSQLLLSTLLSGAVIGFSATPAFAQEAEEDIVVTGTRIVRPNLIAASPVTTIDRDELLNTGVTDVGDLVQSIPSMSGSPIGTTTNNGGNGSVFVNLRGLGSARTLTLVNGQRTVDGGDFQTIPSLMIKRLDVLKDGASAVYGADAVAGVINIITRDDVDGIELTGQYNAWDETNGGAQKTIGAIAGKTFDEGSFVFGAEYVEQEEVFQRDAPWDFFQDSFYIYPQGCENNRTAPYDPSIGAASGCYAAGSSRIPESRIQFINQGRFLVGTPAANPYEAGLLIPHDGRNYNYAPVNYVQTPYNKLNAFAQGKFDVTDTTQFKFEVRANRRESAQELAPQPYDSRSDPAYSGVFNGVAYNGVSEDNYYLRQAVDNFNAAAGLALGDEGALAYEPVRDARRRMIELNRRFEQSVQQIQVNTSLDGELDNVKWDLYGGYGFRSFTQQDFGQFSGQQLGFALGPSADLDGDGQPECYGDINDPSSLIAGCVPFNIFGGGSVTRATGEITASSLTQDMIDYVSASLNDTTDVEFVSAGGGLSGDAWELPGGLVGWAVGAGLWQQSITDTPDSQKQLGTVTGNKGGATQGELKNYHAFAEVLLPVYDNGTQKLELKGGARYDEFDNIGGKTTYQVGATGQLLDSVRVRGTYGTVFRVPTVFDLFQGASDSFPQYSDPCARPVLPAGCAQRAAQDDSQVLARVGGNPNLQPETGDTLTLGVVLQPDFIEDHNLSVTVDYFKMNVENGISNIGVQNTLNACHDDLNEAACSLITRRSADFSVQQILDSGANVSSDTAEGIDTEVRWNHDAGFAELDASIIWTHLLERNFVRFAGQDVAELAGQFSGQSFPKDKFNYSLGLSKGIFSLTYRGEYISGLENVPAFQAFLEDTDYIQTIESKLFHDITVNANIEDYGMRVSAGVTNFTNEAPPYIDSGFNASTDPTTYRNFGRGFFVRGTKTF